MAYFSSGTEGEIYQEQYCYKCKNWKHDKESDTYFCPIWDIHLHYSSDLCNKKTPGKVMLDMLIPMAKNKLSAGKCSMFLND